MVKQGTAWMILGTCCAALAACLLVMLPVEAAYSCSGKHVYPSQNLAQVAGNAGAGTTFCVHDGTHNVSDAVRVQDRDKFVGIYNDSSRPVVSTGKAHQVFNARGSYGNTIKGLKVSGAVGGDYCEPGCGNGIRGGTNLTVDNVHLSGNKNNGIGGVAGALLVQNSIIENNGSYSFSYLDGPPSSAAGIKSSQGSVTVLNSRVRDNYWNGVWCDNDCNGFTVKNSELTGNGKAGIHDEISAGPAVISGNTIKGNGTLLSANRQAGILIISSSHADVYNNTFGGNVGPGVLVDKDGRPPGVNDVKVFGNTLSGDVLTGCSLYGVDCYNN